MITRIEALGFRSLRYVAQDIEPFQVLVAPNGSGKSSFLDVVGFVGAVARRTCGRGFSRRVSGPPASLSRQIPRGLFVER